MGDVREKIADIVADNLGDTYCCTRVWEAWSVGTMSQSDFHLAAEDEDVTFGMADDILAALTPPPLEWYINYDHWEATTPHGRYEVGDGGTNSAWVKFPDGSNMWVKPFEMGKRLCDMDNAVSVLGVKEKEDG